MSAAAAVTTPRERPLVLYPHEVRGVLADRQTMLRRVIDPPPIAKPFQLQGEATGVWLTENRAYPKRGPMFAQQWRCPAGNPGQRLWVRETWRTYEQPDTLVDGALYEADGTFAPIANSRRAADAWTDAYDNGKYGELWRDAESMPKWASRITLEITDVRVERLQSISEDDAKAEGVRLTKLPLAGCVVSHWEDYPTPNVGDEDPRSAFRMLWQSIHGADSWQSNPWVWRVEFRRTGGAA